MATRTTTQQRLLNILDHTPRAEVVVYSGGQWDGAWVGRYKFNRRTVDSLVAHGDLHQTEQVHDENGTPIVVYRRNRNEVSDADRNE